MLIGMAEYESELISERTRAALAAKRARGEKWGGRKKGDRSKLDDVMLKIIEAMLAAKIPKTQIAKRLGISRGSVYEAIKLFSVCQSGPIRRG